MLTKVKTYKELIVWQKAKDLVILIYRLTVNFPDSEKFGLTNQIRRSAVSISSNIAEGWGRFSTKSFIQFLKIARGSLFELETQMIIAKELGYAQDINKIEELIEEISKMIYSLMRNMKTDS